MIIIDNNNHSFYAIFYGLRTVIRDLKINYMISSHNSETCWKMLGENITLFVGEICF